MVKHIRFCCAAYAVLALTALLPAQEPKAGSSTPVGTVVLLRSRESRLLLDSNGTYKESMAEPDFSYRVVAERGIHLKVCHDGTSHWLLKSNAVALAEAVDYFTAQIAQGNNRLDALLRRAAAHILNKNHDHAREDLRGLMEMPADAYPYYVSYAFYLSARIDEAQGNSDEALKSYAIAMLVQPRSLFLAASAACYFRLGKFEKAHDRYSEAIVHDPVFGSSPKWHWCLGEIRYIQRKYKEAEQHFATAIDRNRDFADAYLGRALARIGLRSYDAAIDDANEALRLRPDCLNAYFARADAYQKKREFRLAIDSYDEAARRAQAKYDRLVSTRHPQNGNKSLDENSEALRDIRNVRTRAWRGKAWLLATCPDSTLRNGAEAVRIAAAIVELDDRPANLSLYAAALAEAGRFEEAIRHERLALADSKYREQYGAGGRKRLMLYQANKPFHGDD